MEGVEGDGGDNGGAGALEKLSNKLSGFLNECKNIQVCINGVITIVMMVVPIDTSLCYCTDTAMS